MEVWFVIVTITLSLATLAAWLYSLFIFFWGDAISNFKEGDVEYVRDVQPLAGLMVWCGVIYIPTTLFGLGLHVLPEVLVLVGLYLLMRFTAGRRWHVLAFWLSTILSALAHWSMAYMMMQSGHGYIAFFMGLLLLLPFAIVLYSRTGRRDEITVERYRT